MRKHLTITGTLGSLWRSFRYRLSTALLVITGGCIWLSFAVHRAHLEKSANLAIARLGGAVAYDDEVDVDNLRRRRLFDALPYRRRPAPGPPWLVALVGEEFFREIVAVDLSGRVVRGADFEAVAKLHGLRHLNLSGATLPDDSVHEICQCQRLEDLHLNETRFTDALIEPLLALHHLRILGLGGTHVTDAGLKRMRGTLTSGLCDLEQLDFSNCAVTDDGIVWLVAHVPALRMLDIRGTNVGQSGVQCIREAWPNCVVYGP